MTFIYESLFMFIIVFIMGLSQDEIYFKEVFVLYMAMVISTSYLYFVREQGSFDVFSLLFPQMTIFQIKEVLWDNFLVCERFVERWLIRFRRALRIQDAAQL